MPSKFIATIAAVLCGTLYCAALPAEEIDYHVGVHYYPWYSDDFHGRQYLREHLVPAQLPVLGEYNDRDTEVIDQHLKWSRDSGIDFWSTSWWGPGTRTDVTILDHILNNTNLGRLKIAILYETVGRTNNFHDYSSLRSDITYLANNYFFHPNYLKIKNKPVIIVYLTRVLSSRGTLNFSLDLMRVAAANAGYQLYIVGDHVFGSPPAHAGDIAQLDAVFNYDVYGGMGTSHYAGQSAVDNYYSDQAQWKALAESVGTDYAPAVSPGFNDRGVRGGHIPLSRKLKPSDDFGSLFRAMLQAAVGLTDPDIGDMIFVTSWNEWHEDTQIEPVGHAPPTAVDDSPGGTAYTAGFAYEGYGTRYLEILGELTYPTADTDDDGIPDREEDGGPNGGDGNYDGIPDRRQSRVASFFTYDGQSVVTLETPAGITLNNCEAMDNPSPNNSPTPVIFTHGLFGFSLTNLGPGGGTRVTLSLPAGEPYTTYFKYGPTPTDPSDHWYEFLFDGETGAEINNNVITLYFVDGKRGDSDLDKTNGIITDPGGPAILAGSDDTSSDNGGG
jgi:hypothetical protein